MKRADQKKIDKQLKKMAEQTEPVASREYGNMLDELVDELVGQKKVLGQSVTEKEKREEKEYVTHQKEPKAHVFQRRYIAVALAVVLLVSVPVSAAVSYVSKRMESVPEEEKEKLRDMVQKETELIAMSGDTDKEAITYSRELSKEEKKMYDELWDAYENEGKFPEKGLTVLEGITADSSGKPMQGAAEDYGISDGKEVLPESDTVYYMSGIRCIYLPDRVLTDEELLEIIDFYHILDYSLQTSDEAEGYAKELEERKNQKPEADSMSEGDAVGKAAEYMKTFFGVSVDSMETAVEYIPAELDGRENDYQITFTQGDIRYTVSIECVTGAFGSISKNVEGVEYYQDNLAVDEDKLKLRGADAKKIMQNVLGEDLDITDAYVQYKINGEGLVPHGSAAIFFDLGNGDRVRMQYSIGEDEIWCMFLENGTAGHRDRNVMEGETRIFIELED